MSTHARARTPALACTRARVWVCISDEWVVLLNEMLWNTFKRCCRYEDSRSFLFWAMAWSVSGSVLPLGNLKTQKVRRLGRAGDQNMGSSPSASYSRPAAMPDSACADSGFFLCSPFSRIIDHHPSESTGDSDSGNASTPENFQRLSCNNYTAIPGFVGQLCLTFAPWVSGPISAPSVSLTTPNTRTHDSEPHFASPHSRP
jgi:hypothetical protein